MTTTATVPLAIVCPDWCVEEPASQAMRAAQRLEASEVGQ